MALFTEQKVDHENRPQISINDIVNHIETYAIPFLNKYSNIKNFIHGIEEGDGVVSFYSNYNLPILYLLNGEKDLACSYIQRELARKETISKKAYDDYPFPEMIKEEPSSSEYRDFKIYQEFARKFLERIENYQ